MLCPACQKSQPPSFRCTSCGTEMMKGSYGAPTPSAPPVSATPLPAPSVSFDNPYASPAVVTSPSAGHATGALAARSARLAAVMIDYVAALVVGLPILGSAVLASTAAETDLAAGGITVSLFGLFVLGLIQASLIVRDGQTIGKKLMRIRIVDHRDGQIPPWTRSLGMRYIVNAMLRQVPVYAIVDVLFILGEDQRCLHDHIAGTKVIEA